MGLVLLPVVALAAVSETRAEGPEVVERAFSLPRPGAQEWRGWGEKTPASMVPVLQPQLELGDQAPEAQ